LGVSVGPQGRLDQTKSWGGKGKKGLATRALQEQGLKKGLEKARVKRGGKGGGRKKHNSGDAGKTKIHAKG